MAATGSGTAIRFGMVVIPVKVGGATTTKDVSFNRCHRACGTKLRSLSWCPKCEGEVQTGDVCKGYEVVKGQWVLLEDEDLECVPTSQVRAVDVDGFVDAGEVDPLYFEKSYYVSPEEVSLKPFALFYGLLEGRAAIGRAVLRRGGKPQRCLLRRQNGGVVLHTLFWSDEVKRPEAVDLAGVQLDEGEMELARMLADSMSTVWEPGEEKDEYRQAVLAVIEAKSKGITVAPVPVPPAPKSDLMAALKASIEAAKQAKQAA